jgi:hypothetical protein
MQLLLPFAPLALIVHMRAARCYNAQHMVASTQITFDRRHLHVTSSLRQGW